MLCSVLSPIGNGIVWLCRQCSGAIGTTQKQLLEKPLLHEESKLRNMASKNVPHCPVLWSIFTRHVRGYTGNGLARGDFRREESHLG